MPTTGVELAFDFHSYFFTAISPLDLVNTVHRYEFLGQTSAPAAGAQCWAENLINRQERHKLILSWLDSVSTNIQAGRREGALI